MRALSSTAFGTRTVCSCPTLARALRRRPRSVPTACVTAKLLPACAACRCCVQLVPPCADVHVSFARGLCSCACAWPQLLGADVVGMSMVAEVTAARHAGLRVSATAVVVNLASGMTNKHITHDETIYYSDKAAEKLTTLLKEFLRNSHRW